MEWVRGAGSGIYIGLVDKFRSAVAAIEKHMILSTVDKRLSPSSLTGERIVLEET